jgi:glycosyltransferase involved in cell wall biosynthesis
MQKYTECKCDVVYSPVDARIFYPERFNTGKIRVGFIGPMLEWKGALVAAEIFSKISQERNDVEFVFVGFGPLEMEIRKMGKSFKFYRELSSQQIAKHLNSFDILVSPTKYESFGYLLAEAGMCATPVVSTRVGAVPETVGPGGIIVDYGDWNGMKDQIEHLIDDEKKRRLLGKKAIRHTKKFRDDVVSDNIYKIYKSLS